MLIKSGLASDDLSQAPLDIEGARKLQQRSSEYQAVPARPKLEPLSVSRSKSTGACVDPHSPPIKPNSPNNSNNTTKNETTSPVFSSGGGGSTTKAGLEQVVRM
jgi:hypothetical protein